MPAAVRQAAALALRGGLVCLVTSRTGQRWTLPKGHVERGQTPQECAAAEAYEEAGLVGTPGPGPIGYYDYAKNGRDYRVEVFLMTDFAELADWPERGERVRDWVPAAEAWQRVREEGLRAILAEL